MLDKDLLQLLDQESFLNYCFGRNDNDVRYWNKWLVEHPEDAPQVEDLRKTIIVMGKASQTRLREKHFEELQQMMAGTKVVSLSKKPWFKQPWLISAAASVLLGVGAVWFYYSNSVPVPTHTVLQKKEIGPGGNKAILTLADGRKISLTDSDKGQIAVQSQIKINKTAEGQIVYEIPDNVGARGVLPEYNTIEAPVGGLWQVILPDHSKVWLNARSSLTYPTFFTGRERKVRLKGEAYFEIAHNAEMPFKVVSKDQMVEVLGTHFDIMAYEDEQIIKTTLLQGSIKISDHGLSKILVPGEQAQVTNTMLKVTSQIDIEDVMAWKNGYFKFNENLESIMKKIARWYDVEIRYAENVNISARFGGKISRNKSLSSALKIIELTGNIHFKVEGRRVTVMQ